MHPSRLEQWKKKVRDLLRSFFFNIINQKNVDFCSHPAAVTRYFRMYSEGDFFFFFLPFIRSICYFA